MENIFHIKEETSLILRKVWIQMRLISILLFVITLCANAKTIHSQNALVNLNMENVLLTDVFREIERQSEYRFFYSKDVVNTKNRVNLKTGEKEISEVLKQLFEGTNINYKLVDKQIVITTAKEKETTKLSVVNQQKLIKGKITDEYGEPIIGANVVVKGTVNGVITDVDGNYSIQVPENAVLQFSYIGYLTIEEAVSNQQVMDVILRENVQIMEEVVVIGYGTVKRANLTGAVSTADAKTFQARPVQNAANALMGEVPGLSIIRSGGAPGSSPEVRIRDVSSINGGSPLILIDGAEGDLSLINPADIENVSVLKDGTAAIYGARAADGVILITTKNARRNQKLKITFDANYSIKKPALLKKPADLYQHAAMALEITDGSFPIEYSREELELIAQGSDKIIPAGTAWGRWGDRYPKFYKNQDYNEHIIGNGSLQNYNVSLSGGGEKYSYLISLGHQREEGLPKYGQDNEKRYFVRAKSNIEIIKNLNYDVNISYEAGDRSYSSGITEGQTLWELIYKTRSWAPMYNPAGNYYTFEGFANPLQLLEQGGNTTQTTGNFTINNMLTWQVIDGLNIIGRAVVRKNDSDRFSEYKTLYMYNWDNINHSVNRTPNSAERNYIKSLSKNFTLYAEYKKTFGKHDIGIMAGGSNESEDYDKFWAKRYNYDQQENMSLPLGGSENQEALSNGYGWTINSFFSRLSYSFANKYLIDGTFRADGSSRFHPDERWGYFPGVSAAWRISEEAFIKNLNIFDDLKLKASYGEMGNQSGIGYYDYIQLVSAKKDGDGKVEYYPFGGGQKGQMMDARSIVSTSRTWETIKSTDIGMEFAILDNRLYGSFDYFWKNNDNMLISITYPSTLGVDAPKTNSGKLEVRGWEVALGWRDRIGDFSYSVRGSLSDAKNKVAERIGANIKKVGINEAVQGHPLNSYFGYVFDGIIQNEQDLADYEARFHTSSGIPGHGDLAVGDAKYKDLDGDGKLSIYGDGAEGSGDIVYLGDANPRYSFGVNLGAEYKGFDLSMFIQGIGKRTMFLEGEARMPFAEPWFQSDAYWYGKTWTPERTDARYPAITNNGKKEYNYYHSTNTKHNVAYARMKNLQFGYTIPKSVVSSIGLEKIRVYFSGEDLFEIHNTPAGWDPEELGVFKYDPNSGNVTKNHSLSFYPFSRNFSFGASIVF